MAMGRPVRLVVQDKRGLMLLHPERFGVAVGRFPPVVGAQAFAGRGS